MAKKDVKKYLDIDVYQAAKERIKHTIDIFDTVLVAFSGGKDSLCTMNLVREVYDELGIQEKVKVFFRDEEVIPDNVIEFVKSICESGVYDFRYYAIPLKSTKFILGKSYEYVQFDRDREWLRQPPEYAIRMSDDEYRVLSQYDADEFICRNEKGKVAIINGIRADESLIRLRSCINKKNENYINATESRRINVVKPIYDWTEKDVLLYFYKNNIKYCDIYDEEYFNGEMLRVSTPLHAESAKRLYKIKTRNPEFYDRLQTLFPEIIVQEKYWDSLSREKGDFDKYERNLSGLMKYIDDTITDVSQNKLAKQRILQAYNTRVNKMKEGRTENYGGYPLLYLMKVVQTGAYKRAIQPKGKPSKDDIAFENGR